MANHLRSLLLLTFMSLLLSSCNLPQLSQDAAMESQEDVVACSYEALMNMFVEKSEVTLSPGCVYEIPSSPFHAGGMSECTAGLPIIVWTGYIIHGNGATLRRVPDPDRTGWSSDFRFFYITRDGALTIEDLTLEHSPRQRVGMATLAVVPAAARMLEEALELRGWRVVYR